MKKILIYINSLNASGGIERVVSNLTYEWVKKYEVILLTKDDGIAYYDIPDSIKKVSLNIPLKLDMNNKAQRIKMIINSFLATNKLLKNAVEDIEPDYIYTTNPMNALEITYSLKHTKSKLVVSEHGSYYGYNKIYTFIKKMIYPKAYRISVLNKMDTDIYRGWKANAVYIPHLVTYKAIEKNPLNSKILLNVGRLTGDKQQGLLIDMWSKVKEKNGWQLWIVGDGEDKLMLESKIEKLNLEDSVKLIPATKQIADIYRQASFFAFSSRCEGFGMVLLEAMSFGIPCISFDCPSGPRDIVVDDYNGFLVADKDAESYIKKLEKIVSMNDAELKRLGDGAFTTVEQWDNEDILKKWNEIYK